MNPAYAWFGLGFVLGQMATFLFVVWLTKKIRELGKKNDIKVQRVG